MVFKDGGQWPQRLNCIYGGDQIDIVNKFSYLGIVFTTGGSFHNAQVTLWTGSESYLYT